jgi:hypothetical protein
VAVNHVFTGEDEVSAGTSVKVENSGSNGDQLKPQRVRKTTYDTLICQEVDLEIDFLTF